MTALLDDLPRFGVLSVFPPVVGVPAGNGCIADDQQVFGVPFLRGFGEVERAGDDADSVDDLHLVVGDGVRVVDQHGHLDDPEGICGNGPLLFALPAVLTGVALVQNDPDIDAPSFGVDQCFHDLRRREAVGLNQHLLSGRGNLTNDDIGTFPAGRETHGHDVGGESGCRSASTDGH